MAPSKKKIKIQKSVRALSNFADTGLFFRGKVKEDLSAKILIGNAKKLATGIRTKKEAIEALQTFFDFSTKHGKVKYVFPRKNKNLYAEELEISGRFKVYPMPIYTEKDTYIKTSDNGKEKLRLKGPLVDVELFPFTNKRALAKSPDTEVKKIVKKANTKYGKKRRKVYKIKVGEHYTNAQMEEKFLIQEIKRFFREYSGPNSGRKKADYAAQWVKGVQVFTFNKQKDLPPRKNAKKKRAVKNARERNRNKTRLK